KLWIRGTLLLAMVVLLASCGGGNKITIGAQTYTETKLMAYMYKELIEDQTDVKVDVKEDLATSPIVLEGMQKGEIDMSTQYTGTAIASFADIETSDDSYATLEQSRDIFVGENCEFGVFQPLRFANPYSPTLR